MSLTVYLYAVADKAAPAGSGIFVRENGETREALCSFVSAYLTACRAYPDARISVCR